MDNRYFIDIDIRIIGFLIFLDGIIRLVTGGGWVIIAGESSQFLENNPIVISLVTLEQPLSVGLFQIILGGLNAIGGMATLQINKTGIYLVLTLAVISFLDALIASMRANVSFLTSYSFALQMLLALWLAFRIRGWRSPTMSANKVAGSTNSGLEQAPYSSPEVEKRDGG